MKTTPQSQCSSKLAAAIKIGEDLVDQVIDLANKRRNLCNAMGRAIHQLAHGCTDQAKRTLQYALEEDEKQ